MTRDTAFRPGNAYHRLREMMTRIPPQIGSSSFQYSGISVAAARSVQSPSSIEKKISQATAKSAVRTNERSTNYLNGTAVAIVDFSRAEAYRDGVKVPLPANEVKVLSYFIDNLGPRNFSARIVEYGVGLQRLSNDTNCGQPDMQTPAEARARSKEFVSFSELASQHSKKYRLRRQV